MKRIVLALLGAAAVWILVHTLDLAIAIEPRHGRWVGALLAFVAILWIVRKRG